MARRMISTTVYLTAEQDAQLRRLAQLTRVRMADWVRDGVDLVLARARGRGELPAAGDPDVAAALD